MSSRETAERIDLTDKEMEELSAPYRYEREYDTEISPLMDKLADACKRHRIPMLAMAAWTHDGFALTGTSIGGGRTPTTFLAIMAMLKLGHTPMVGMIISTLASLYTPELYEQDQRRPDDEAD